jgi:hypothetical protein
LSQATQSASDTQVFSTTLVANYGTNGRRVTHQSRGKSMGLWEDADVGDQSTPREPCLPVWINLGLLRTSGATDGSECHGQP